MVVTLTDVISEAAAAAAAARRALPDLERHRQQLLVDARLGQATAADVEAVEQEIAAQRAAVADAETIEREAVARLAAEREAARAAAIQEMDAALGRLDTERRALLDQVRALAHPPADLVDTYAVVARQMAALAHDLFSLTGALRHQQLARLDPRIGVPDAAVGACAHLARGLVARPPIARPWLDLLLVARGDADAL